MKKKAKKREPQHLHPFCSGRALQHMSEAIDIMMEQILGYKPSDRNALMEGITRMAIAASKGNNPGAQAELDRLMDRYEKKYRWLHDLE